MLQLYLGMLHIHEVKYDHQCKMSAAYREQQHSAHNSTPTPIQHKHGPNSQTQDVSPLKGWTVCVWSTMSAK